MDDDPKIGQDTVIGRGSVVGSGAVIGENVVIGDGATVGGERSSTEFSLLTPESFTSELGGPLIIHRWMGEAESRIYRACEKIGAICEMRDPFNEFTYSRLRSKCAELSLLMQTMEKAARLHQEDASIASLFSNALTRVRTPANRSIQMAASLFPYFETSHASDLTV